MKKKLKEIGKTKNPIHIKFEYDEAVNSKKDVLSAEVNILQMNQSIKKYRALRIRELKMKIKIHKKIKEFISDINHLEKTLPEIKVPRFLIEHPAGSNEHIFRPAEVMDKKDRDLESQLREIQQKLRALER